MRYGDARCSMGETVSARGFLIFKGIVLQPIFAKGTRSLNPSSNLGVTSGFFKGLLNLPQSAPNPVPILFSQRSRVRDHHWCQLNSVHRLASTCLLFQCDAQYRDRPWVTLSSESKLATLAKTVVTAIAKPISSAAPDKFPIKF